MPRPLTAGLIEPGAATRALCHPKRPEAGEGLCRQCLAKQSATPPANGSLQALERKKRIELMELHKSAGKLDELFGQAKAILRERLPDYADLHWEASKNAAEKGDSRPIEWALSQVKADKGPVVEPPAKVPESAGVKVFVGIRMGGVPTDALPDIQIEETTPKDVPIV